MFLIIFWTLRIICQGLNYCIKVSSQKFPISFLKKLDSLCNMQRSQVNFWPPLFNLFSLFKLFKLLLFSDSPFYVHYSSQEEEPRVAVIEKGQYPLGITIAQGQNNGIFVADVTEESIASRSGLKCGDQLLEVKFVFQSCIINPSRPSPGQREKINLNMYFHTSLWCPKRFNEDLKVPHKNLLRHHKEVWT